MNMVIRSNKGGHAGVKKLGQYFNLSVKYIDYITLLFPVLPKYMIILLPLCHISNQNHYKLHFTSHILPG